MSPWLADEKRRLTDFFTLLIELASARAWSQIQFATCQPNGLAACLNPNRAIGQQMIDWSKRIWKAVLAAESLVETNKLPNTVKKELKKILLYDVCWNQLQIARECYLICEKASWDANHPDIQRMAKQMFGGPANTKYTLEDLFAHLTSVGKLSSLATPMNKPLGTYYNTFYLDQEPWRLDLAQKNWLNHFRPLFYKLTFPEQLRWTRYFYCTTMPSLRELEEGWPEFKTTCDDHILDHESLKSAQKKSGKCFTLKNATLPKEIKQGILGCKVDNCKRAGTNSNQRAAASSAWMVHNVSTNFQSVTMAWTGQSWGYCLVSKK